MEELCWADRMGNIPDDDIEIGPIFRFGASVFDFPYNSHTIICVYNTAKDNMFVVQPRRHRRRDEELRAVCIWA